MKINKNSSLIGLAIIGIIITGALIFANKNYSPLSFFGAGLSNDKIVQQSMDYINNKLLQGQSATLVSTSEESGLIKIKIKVGSTEYNSYATKDGKLLFPEAFQMNGSSASSTTQQPAQNNQPTAEEIAAAATSLKKSNSPLLEAYIVSRCPYGLQMQRAMADAVKNLPSLAQYIKIRYMGAVSNGVITSMHGDAEAKENLRQICIRDEQSSKYWNYVSCQMKTGDTAGCEKSTGVDSAKLNACTSDSGRGLAYAKEDFNLSGKNDVQGSPTLISADAKVSEFSFGGRSSDAVKNIICGSFNSAPGFCSTKLNTAEAAVSFSADYAGAGGSGNSGTNGTNCAPAQ